MELNKYIDHTLLKPTATINDIEELCKEAKTYSFYAVCVNGCYVNVAREALKDSNIKIAAVIGFPLGAMSTNAKIEEAKQCINDGAHEIDMVINIGFLKSGEIDRMREEIAAIKKAIGSRVLKVIIETCYLTTEEKILACKAAMDGKADFVKTATGFGTGGATLEDVRLMKHQVGDRLQIKASGGIKTLHQAKEYLDLGVTRLGTSSGIQLMESNRSS
ncbi:deoxyribose-phosphate aldolase [Gillisia sp. M10.2A]|uniref:Deoxyribose-phosphate aldolase n=1 Tax=Gillisia lutea TaxID=2909668 RepID=A0ABS9EHL1_9FLAO|nr:deoxyribose-phosphate aldolase [Gillisia lutea]MCF4101649.1 deoxyribose-phosphate aldolase [Gillisia lutea]